MDKAPLLIYFLVITGVILFWLWKALGGWKSKHPLNLEEYLAKYPSAKTKSGIACGVCGSKSLRNLGVNNATDSRRLVSCNSCSSPLYHAKH